MRAQLKITLLSYELLPGAFSDEGKRVEKRREIYANEFSTGLDAALRARNEGLWIEGRVEIYSFEYEGEEYVEVRGKTYRVLSVTRKGDKAVLTYGEEAAHGD